MAKKTLDEKINNIKKIFFIGTPAYILLSLLLLNDYSYEANFDPKKVYDVIKDGFALSAAFLAPVAALALFTDWRDEHRTKSLLSTIELIKLKAKEIEFELKDSENKINSTKFDTGEDVTYFYEKEEITQKLSDLYFLYEDLDKKESKIIEYRKEVQSFLNKASIARNKLFAVENNFILKSKFENLKNSTGMDEQRNLTEITQKYNDALQVYKSVFQEVGNSFDTIISLTTLIKNNM